MCITHRRQIKKVGWNVELKETFEKQGGKKLLKQYWKGGAFFTAINQFIVLGRSRTALEILRLSATLKTKQKLEKRYGHVIENFKYDDSLPHQSSNKVWICWFQGIENAPEIVKKCYESVLRNMPDKEVVLLTDENIKEYVRFPDYIQEKYEKGIITRTHMTDLLRLELLIRYGGMWLDATVFCSSSEIPDYFFESELFFYQLLKPGRDGNSSYISSWLMTARTNNRILMATRELCYVYWKDNDDMWDYFLFHDFMAIVMEKYEEEWKKIILRDNATPHELLLKLFDSYDEQMWNAIKEQTPFHKLTYKFREEETKKESTFYKVLFE